MSGKTKTIATQYRNLPTSIRVYRVCIVFCKLESDTTANTNILHLQLMRLVHVRSKFIIIFYIKSQFKTEIISHMLEKLCCRWDCATTDAIKLKWLQNNIVLTKNPSVTRRIIVQWHHVTAIPAQFTVAVTTDILLLTIHSKCARQSMKR